MWHNCYTTISLWRPTNSVAKISASFTGIQNLQKIPANFWGGISSYRHVCLKKAQKSEVLCLSPFWNMNFGVSKVSYLLSFWSFWDMIWKGVSFLSLDNQFKLHLCAGFHSKFEHKFKSFNKVKKCEEEKNGFFLSVHFQLFPQFPC